MSWLLILTMGIYGVLGHLFVIKAYAQASASALAPFGYSQMIGMAALGWLVFGQLPDRWTFVGATIIAASSLYILHRERILRLRASRTLGA
jgi:drug/metabolite transporter (DMT)-like permease